MSGGSLVGGSRVDIVLLLGALLAVYGAGWWRLRRRAPRLTPGWRAGCYLASVGAVGLALLSPIDRLAEELFRAHMIQHLLLIKVAAPALLLANPLPTIIWGLPRPLRARVGGLLVPGAPIRIAWRALTSMPLTWLIYAFTLWFWHLPVAYDAALEERFLHDVEHLAFLAAGILFWWPLILPAPRVRTAVSPGLRVAYLVVGAFQEALLGLLLVLSPEALYRSYSGVPGQSGITAIEDQAGAGILMWAVGGAVDMVATIALLSHTLGNTRRGSGAS